ncbi:tautomerase family protein [Trinickia mobilis]|uniref:tautomerase family protein n=1 Tax=Trinickia mobilis TaxID=2816356 RepID=UPI001A8EBD66|nr:tautomerase family protein [Trinickia mobilis]
MPFIHCNIHTGVSPEAKHELAQELIQIVHETIGSPIPYIHVAIVEVPGSEFVESGQLNFQYGAERLSGDGNAKG